MKKANRALWILVPLCLVLALGSIWGTFRFGPSGSKAYLAKQCDTLKTFILDEEMAGKADWTIYKRQVSEYLALDVEANRTSLVESMVTSVVKVLEHDLKIYERMNKYPSCLVESRKDELPTLLDETQSAIDYLNTSFSAETGEWNTDFYVDYISASEFLKGGEESADARAKN